MGNSNSIIKVNFEDVQNCIINNNCILINVMKNNSSINNSSINNSFNFINHIFDSTIQKKCLLD